MQASSRALRQVLLNALSLLGAYALPRAFTFASAVVAARVLGVPVFGEYGAAAALAVILSIVSTLGMMQLLVRELARAPDRAPRLIGAANVAKLGSGAIMLALLWSLAAGPLALSPEARAAALLLGAAYAVGGWAENLGAWFEAVERMGVWMEAQALFGVISGLGGIGLVLATRSMVWFCVAPLAGQLAALAWLTVRAPKSLARAWRAPWSEVRSLLASLVPFTVAFVLLTTYYKLDILLLERWRGDGQAGLYAAAYKFVDVAQALALVAATAIYPRLSRAALGGPADDPVAGAEEGGKTRGWAAARAAELLLLASVPAAALLWLLRGPVITGLFGRTYGGSVEVMGLLAPALPALTVNMLATYVLAAAGRMGAVAGMYGGGVVLTVALNRMLIPTLGASGAAAAMLISETTLAAGFVVVMRRLLSTRLAARAVGAAAAVVVVAGLLGRTPLPPVAASVLCAVASVAVYAALRVVAPRELRLLREAILG